MSKGKIFQIQNYSVNDGEGIRTTIFFTGCPLRCVWCGNPEGFSEEKELSIEDVVSKVKNQLIFYRKSSGGVTFSGGEATMQIDFLDEISKKLYDMGIDLAIETCGYFDFEKTRSILEKMNMIFFDLKHMNSVEHKEKTGVANNSILENAKKVYGLGIPMVIRVPFIIGYNNSPENIERLAEFIKINLPKAKLEILPYHKLGEEKYKELGLKLPPKELEIPTEKEIQNCKEYLNDKGINLVSYT